MKSPQIDVIMPVFNRVDYLAAAVQSILDEQALPIRLITVDDGSTDGSFEMLTDWAARERRLHLVKSGHRGVSHARNLGLEAAEAPFVSFLDSDDVSVPGRLVRQLAKLEATPAVAAVMGHRLYFKDDIQNPFSRKLDICLASAVFRRSAIDATGVFDEDLSFGEDLDFYMRFLEVGNAILVEAEDAIYYRRHDGNMTRDENAVRMGLHRAAHKAIKRRRNQGRRNIDLFFFKEYSVDTLINV